jgi:hypothetical protein
MTKFLADVGGMEFMLIRDQVSFGMRVSNNMMQEFLACLEHTSCGHMLIHYSMTTSFLCILNA